MKYQVVKDSGEAAHAAALKVKAAIEKAVAKKGFAVVGFATGNTPIPLYNELIAMNRRGELSFEQVKTVNLDEYVGANEYKQFMHEHLFDHLNPPPKEIHIPETLHTMPDHAASSYRETLRTIKEQGGIDVQILGIGENGHIGFNEPSDTLRINQSAHVETLTNSTREVNDTPHTQAVTMGMRDIMQAKEVITLATGNKKAAVLGQMSRTSAPTKQQIQALPALVLHYHPNATLFADEPAAARMGEMSSGLKVGEELTVVARKTPSAYGR